MPPPHYGSHPAEKSFPASPVPCQVPDKALRTLPESPPNQAHPADPVRSYSAGKGLLRIVSLPDRFSNVIRAEHHASVFAEDLTGQILIQTAHIPVGIPEIIIPVLRDLFPEDRVAEGI